MTKTSDRVVRAVASLCRAGKGFIYRDSVDGRPVVMYPILAQKLEAAYAAHARAEAKRRWK